MGAPMMKLRKISGLVFAGLLMTSAAVPVASASEVSDLFDNLPNGGDEFLGALALLFGPDQMGFAQAVAAEWPDATDAQKSSLQQYLFCGEDEGETAAIRAVLPFTQTAPCVPEDDFTTPEDAPPPTPFRRTSTGTNNNGGFGGGSISPNTQQNNTNDNGPQ